MVTFKYLKRLVFVAAPCCACLVCAANATPNGLYEAISNARDKCYGISDDLKRVRGMAVVNTAVTGAGTVAGGVAVYAGLRKSNVDKKIAKLKQDLANLDNMTDQEFVKFIGGIVKYNEAVKEYNTMCQEKKRLSKNLGNLRTGMMAVNTATAVAGTIVANKNENDGRSIAERINDCKTATDALKPIMGQSIADGDMTTYQRLGKIVNTCGFMYPKHLEKIYKNSRVAKISSSINVGTGLAGTITSALANSNSVRNAENGEKREKNLNTASNILAGASTVASGVSTVFNASTIKAIDDNIKYTSECEGALSEQ